MRNAECCSSRPPYIAMLHSGNLFSASVYRLVSYRMAVEVHGIEKAYIRIKI